MSLADVLSKLVQELQQQNVLRERTVEQLDNINFALERINENLGGIAQEIGAYSRRHPR